MVTSQLVRTPKELLKSPSFLLKRLGTIAKDKTVEEFERAGATAYSYAVLAVLEEGTRETQATIADALCWDRSYLVGLLDLLEEQGMVERKRDAADRRRHVVSMTPAGRKELERLRQVHDRVDETLFAPLTATELKALQGLLAKLAAAQDPRYRD
jgi:MarR family transcriptional regulator, lower aerobic nicotinate degradation pathway regulator